MRGNTATISVSALRVEWASHIPMRALCERFTITRDQLIRLADLWQLPRRHDRRLRAKPERQRDPTKSEIRAACLRIQATWDERTREERRVTKSKEFTLQRIEVPDELEHMVDDLNAEMQ